MANGGNGEETLCLQTEIHVKKTQAEKAFVRRLLVSI